MASDELCVMPTCQPDGGLVHRGASGGHWPHWVWAGGMLAISGGGMVLSGRLGQLLSMPTIGAPLRAFGTESGLWGTAANGLLASGATLAAAGICFLMYGAFLALKWLRAPSVSKQQRLSFVSLGVSSALLFGAFPAVVAAWLLVVFMQALIIIPREETDAREHQALLSIVQNQHQGGVGCEEVRRHLATFRPVSALGAQLKLDLIQGQMREAPAMPGSPEPGCMSIDDVEEHIAAVQPLVERERNATNWLPTGLRMRRNFDGPLSLVAE